LPQALAHAWVATLPSGKLHHLSHGYSEASSTLRRLPFRHGHRSKNFRQLLPALLVLLGWAGLPHFLSQDAAVQALAVDLMYYHPAIQEVTLRTTAMLCLAPAYPAELGVRAIEVSTTAQRRVLKNEQRIWHIVVTARASLTCRPFTRCAICHVDKLHCVAHQTFL